MTFPRRLRRPSRLPLVAAGSFLSLALVDCASPGPPRPPSLALPAPVRDLVASRVGGAVELRFTVPHETTDGQPLRGGMALGSVCRAEGSGPCTAFGGAPTLTAFPVLNAAQAANVVTLRDELDAPLRSGPARPLLYRVEFYNRTRRSAGAPAAAFAAAGEAPPAVAGLEASGSRSGVLLAWAQSPASNGDEVLLHREASGKAAEPPHARPGLSGAPGRPSPAGKPAEGAVWLQANGGPMSQRTLDDSAEPGQTYGYTAQRRRTVSLQGHTLELRSELSARVLFTLADTFPPAPPANLTAAGFGEAGHYAVDLIWEPIGDRGVTGYSVDRTVLGPDAQPQGPATTLTAAPVSSPAFHDTTADPRLRYRYSVVAVDARGNRSAATTVEVAPVPSS